MLWYGQWVACAEKSAYQWPMALPSRAALHLARRPTTKTNTRALGELTRKECRVATHTRHFEEYGVSVTDDDEEDDQ